MSLRPLLCSVGILALTTGCNSNGESSSQTGRVAIIDLDEVFKRIGREAQVTRELESKQAALDRQLRETQTKLKGDREAKAKEFGETPTDEQAKQLQELSVNLGSQFATERQRAQREFETLRVELARRFREEVRPIARDVAKARGLDVVLTKADTVLVAPPEADITEAVIERMSAASPAPQPEKKK